MARTRPVRITRSIKGSELIEGYVVGVGRRWVAVWADDSNVHEGWDLIRLRDVAKVQRVRGERADFLAHVLQLQGTWPPRALDPPVDLDRTGGLLADLHARGALLALHVERLNPDILLVGKDLQLSRHPRFVGYRFLTPQATWIRRRRWERRRDISRVQLGTRYLATLQLALDARGGIDTCPPVVPADSDDAPRVRNAPPAPGTRRPGAGDRVLDARLSGEGQYCSVPALACLRAPLNDGCDDAVGPGRGGRPVADVQKGRRSRPIPREGPGVGRGVP